MNKSKCCNAEIKSGTTEKFCINHCLRCTKLILKDSDIVRDGPQPTGGEEKKLFGFNIILDPTLKVGEAYLDNGKERIQIFPIQPSKEEKLKEEIEITDKLLARAEEVLKLIPECPNHGDCLPFKEEWIEQRLKELEFSKEEECEHEGGGEWGVKNGKSHAVYKKCNFEYPTALFEGNITSPQKSDDSKSQKYDRVEINNYIQAYSEAYALFVIPEHIKKIESREQVEVMKENLENLHSLIQSLLTKAYSEGVLSVNIKEMIDFGIKQERKRCAKIVEEVKKLCVGGLLTDGSNHKQWYLEKILEKLGYNLEELRKKLLKEDYEWEDGIAP